MIPIQLESLGVFAFAYAIAIAAHEFLLNISCFSVTSPSLRKAGCMLSISVRARERIDTPSKLKLLLMRPFSRFKYLITVFSMKKKVILLQAGANLLSAMLVICKAVATSEA